MSPDEPTDDAGQVTRLLAEVRGGDRRALDRIFNLVYAELHGPPDGSWHTRVPGRR